MVTWIPEGSWFRTPFESQRVHVSQTLPKSARQHFYPNFPLTMDKLSHKTSLSVRCEISRLLGSTFTAEHMYYRRNWENLPQHIEMELSQKPEILSPIFILFLICTQNFAHFEKKDHFPRLNIWQVIESKQCGYFNARKLLFYNTLWDSTSSRVPNTAEIFMAALLS